MDVHRTESDDIASLQTDTAESIEGDIFVDCSGFRGTLIQQTLETTFQSFEENLFNDRTTQRFEKIRDYIVAHYIMNTRDDTDYWRQNGANTRISDRLRQIMRIWKEGKSLSREIERLPIPTSYTAMSWSCLLAGYGFYPEVRELAAGHSAAKQVNMEGIDDFVRRCSINFGSQGELLSSFGSVGK